MEQIGFIGFFEIREAKIKSNEKYGHCLRYEEFLYPDRYVQVSTKFVDGQEVVEEIEIPTKKEMNEKLVGIEIKKFNKVYSR